MVQKATRLALKTFGGFLAAWYTSAMLVFMQQESKVGWPKFKSKARFAMYGAGVFCGLSLQQWYVVATYLVFGGKAARKAAATCSFSVHNRLINLFFMPPNFEGLENLPPGDEGCIYVCNHTSSCDMSISQFLPNRPHLAPVAKASIWMVPGLGAMSSFQGAIFINRSARGGAIASLVETGKSRLAEGISIGIFPQGTRKVPRVGKPMPEFKKGTFVLADQSRARIIPMTMVYPPDFMCRRMAVKFIIHPPVTPKGDGDIEGLRKQIETICLAPLHKALEAGGYD